MRAFRNRFSVRTSSRTSFRNPDEPLVAHPDSLRTRAGGLENLVQGLRRSPPRSRIDLHRSNDLPLDELANETLHGLPVRYGSLAEFSSSFGGIRLIAWHRAAHEGSRYHLPSGGRRPGIWRYARPGRNEPPSDRSHRRPSDSRCPAAGPVSGTSCLRHRRNDRTAARLVRIAEIVGDLDHIPHRRGGT